MKPDRLLIGSVISLALGASVLFGYCQGNSSLSLGDSLGAASIHIDITTTGAAALAGLALSAIGSLLLAIAWFVALLAQFRPSQPYAPIKRREAPFQE